MGVSLSSSAKWCSSIRLVFEVVKMVLERLPKFQHFAVESGKYYFIIVAEAERFMVKVD